MWTTLLVFSQLILYSLAQYGIDRSSSNIDMQQQIPQQILPPCPGLWQWGCKNGECIAQYDVCDGIAQCSDGSDEWNCNDLSRLKQNPGHAAVVEAGGRPAAGAATTTATTTTSLPQSTYITMNKRQVVFAFTVFFVMAIGIVLFIRRRARQKAVFRNRRTGMLQDDSDEDDVLISSMYS